MAAMTTPSLPPKESPHIHLVVGTPEEHAAQQVENSEEWRGALSLEAYLRREEHLLHQSLTKDGGLTPWMLVYKPEEGPQQVICGCESIKKRAISARAGKVEDVVAHGICSVFCPTKYRGKGYAGRMMSEVGKKLRAWQTHNGTESAFSVLYSDIGKDFYAARGWHPFPSAHVSLPATPSPASDLPNSRILSTEDLAELYTIDERLLRTRLSQTNASGRTAVALVPDDATLAWHRAREVFVSNDLYKKSPQDRGAIVGDVSGSRVWCYWTRVWTNAQEKAPNTLHILRLVVEDDAAADFSPASEEQATRLRDSATVRATAALLARAQDAARQWDMKEVQIWNPTSATLSAARLLDPNAVVMHREEESITSLQWYGEGSWKDVDWVCNEKYGWC